MLEQGLVSEEARRLLGLGSGAGGSLPAGPHWTVRAGAPLLLKLLLELTPCRLVMLEQGLVSEEARRLLGLGSGAGGGLPGPDSEATTELGQL